MQNSEKTRFCVGNINRHSSLFTVVRNKNDIYVISSGKENQMKLSIHESGACQTSFTSEYIIKNSIVNKNQDRHLMKLELYPLSERYEIVTSYIFPYKEIILDNNILKQNIKWIGLPKKNQYVEVIFCRAKKLNFSMKLPYQVLFTLILPDNSIFIVMYRYCPMNEMIEDKIKIANDYFNKNKRKTQSLVCMSMLFEDEYGHRFEMELYRKDI